MAKVKRTGGGGFLTAPVEEVRTPDYLIVELRHDSRVAYSPAAFEAPPEAEDRAQALNKVLSAYEIRDVRSHFGLSKAKIERRITAAPPSLDVPVDSDFAHGGFWQVVPKDPKELNRIVGRLKKCAAVWDAFVAPRPLPAAARRAAAGPGSTRRARTPRPTGPAPDGKSAGSRNFEPSQGYLSSPPNGVGATEVWRIQGGRGEGVTICDIEGNWNLSHEDLPRGITLIGGEPINDLSWRNHGTAVLGEMVSMPSNIGTVGVSPRARARVFAAVIGGVFNSAGAIAGAAAALSAGDVILVELQAAGPTGNYVAMQYWSDVFSAIRAAVDKGITVVEAAGNGNEDFNAAIYKNTLLQKDSGAIVVGAGVPPTNVFDAYGMGSARPGYSTIGVPRSRIFFSNHGSIVNLQGWGWHVTTLGYGDAQGGASEDQWYTLRFSGTSSASPIVTGAVACLQGRARALGGPLTPARVRSILTATGTPQEKGPNVPVSQNIGPLPNLPAAFKKLG